IMATEPTTGVRVLMEFVGGPVDGLTADSATADPDVAAGMHQLYLMCDEGKVGGGFQTLSPAAVTLRNDGGETKGGTHRHTYRVIMRREIGNTVALWFAYRGAGC